jgi:biotin carboxyl carrier protein
VRVLELAFVRTREFTKRVAANREEKVSRAERRREARRQAKEARRAATPTASPAQSLTLSNAQVRREDLTSPAAGRLWEMLRRVQSAPAPDGPAPARAHPPPG